MIQTILVQKPVDVYERKKRIEAEFDKLDKLESVFRVYNLKDEEKEIVFGGSRGKVFKSLDSVKALEKVYEFSGKRSFISMPRLLEKVSKCNFFHEIWQEELVVNSEAYVIGDEYFVIHGGGVFSNPKRLDALHKTSEDNRYRVSSAKLSQKEKKKLLKGRLPDGRKFKFYKLDDTQEKEEVYGMKLPARYVKEEISIDLIDNVVSPVAILHAGGINILNRYLKHAKYVKETHRMIKGLNDKTKEEYFLSNSKLINRIGLRYVLDLSSQKQGIGWRLGYSRGNLINVSFSCGKNYGYLGVKRSARL